MAARSRGLGITSKDMEASRLVFVYVKDSKPRRKVAIPVPESYTLDQFLTQVKTKLKLSGIADIYFSATGVKVTNVSDLQDIDELCVVEGAADAAPPAANGHAAAAAGSAQRSGAELANGNRSSVSPHDNRGDSVISPTSMLQQRQASLQQPDRHRVVVSTDGLMPSSSASWADEGDHKYARRAHPLKRTLQRLFPGMFAPGLPVTNRDAQQLESSAEGGVKGSRRRRVRRSPYNMRNLLLVLFTMSCVIMMLYLFIWVSSSPTMADMSAQHVGGGGSSSSSSDGGGSSTSSSLQQQAAQAAQAAAAGAGGGGAVHQPAPIAATPKQPAGGVAGAVVTGAGLAGQAAGLAGQATGSLAAGAAGARSGLAGAAEAAGKAAAAGHQ